MNARKPKPKLTQRARRKLVMAAADMVRRHTVQLSEHFSSVQIIVTRLESNGTTSAYAYGQGDLFARMKNAEIWLDEQEYAVRS